MSSIEDKIKKSKVDTCVALAYPDNVRFKRRQDLKHVFTSSELEALLKQVAKKGFSAGMSSIGLYDGAKFDIEYTEREWVEKFIDNLTFNED